jgi:hypothetical protein
MTSEICLKKSPLELNVTPVQHGCILVATAVIINPDFPMIVSFLELNTSQTAKPAIFVKNLRYWVSLQSKLKPLMMLLNNFLKKTQKTNPQTKKTTIPSITYS